MTGRWAPTMPFLIPYSTTAASRTCVRNASPSCLMELSHAVATARGWLDQSDTAASRPRGTCSAHQAVAHQGLDERVTAVFCGIERGADVERIPFTRSTSALKPRIAAYPDVRLSLAGHLAVAPSGARAAARPPAREAQAGIWCGTWLGCNQLSLSARRALPFPTQALPPACHQPPYNTPPEDSRFRRGASPRRPPVRAMGCDNDEGERAGEPRLYDRQRGGGGVSARAGRGARPAIRSHSCSTIPPLSPFALPRARRLRDPLRPRRRP